MQFPATPVRLLASVTNVAEARLALAEGADIIDAKNPLEGALGALSLETVASICRAVDGRVPVSATIGDLPSEPDPVGDAVARMASTGADFVKVGFYGGDREHETVAHLGCVDVGASQLVGVLFADQSPDFGLIPAMAGAGFAGVLLDTSEKKAGSLPELCKALAAHVDSAELRDRFLKDVASLARG